MSTEDPKKSSKKLFYILLTLVTLLIGVGTILGIIFGLKGPESDDGVDKAISEKDEKVSSLKEEKLKQEKKAAEEKKTRIEADIRTKKTEITAERTELSTLKIELESKERRRKREVSTKESKYTEKPTEQIEEEEKIATMAAEAEARCATLLRTIEIKEEQMINLIKNREAVNQSDDTRVAVLAARITENKNKLADTEAEMAKKTAEKLKAENIRALAHSEFSKAKGDYTVKLSNIAALKAELNSANSALKKTIEINKSVIRNHRVKLGLEVESKATVAIKSAGKKAWKKVGGAMKGAFFLKKKKPDGGEGEEPHEEEGEEEDEEDVLFEEGTTPKPPVRQTPAAGKPVFTPRQKPTIVFEELIEQSKAVRTGERESPLSPHSHQEYEPRPQSSHEQSGDWTDEEEEEEEVHSDEESLAGSRGSAFKSVKWASGMSPSSPNIAYQMQTEEYQEDDDYDDDDDEESPKSYDFGAAGEENDREGGRTESTNTAPTPRPRSAVTAKQTNAAAPIPEDEEDEDEEESEML